MLLLGRFQDKSQHLPLFTLTHTGVWKSFLSLWDGIQSFARRHDKTIALRQGIERWQRLQHKSLLSYSYGSRHSFITPPMGIYRDELRHIHSLITFLSVRVNARCILLIQTTVFITSNGLWERKKGGQRKRLVRKKMRKGCVCVCV